MTSFTRAAILGILPVAVSCLFSSIFASAQHQVVPPPHPVPPVHVYAPPVYHAPMIPTPTVRSPIVYAPISGPLRGATIPSVGSYRSSIVLPPIRPIRPIHRTPPLLIIYTPPFFFGEPFWQFNFCWDANCDYFWPWTPGYASVSYPAPTNYVLQVSETPVYVYGDEREDFPQLYLKDGTILNVTDYWVVDNQLHFKAIEEAGMKTVEHAVPFDELDLQKTVDVNTRRGFHFLLRNEPFEEYVRDHPEGPPPPGAVPPQQ